MPFFFQLSSMSDRDSRRKTEVFLCNPEWQPDRLPPASWRWRNKMRMHTRCFAWWQHLAGTCHVSAAVMVLQNVLCHPGTYHPCLVLYIYQSFVFSCLLQPTGRQWLILLGASLKPRGLPILPLSVKGANRDSLPSKGKIPTFWRSTLYRIAFL